MSSQPKHYTFGEVECIDAIRSSMSPLEFQGYCKGNILKYVWRFREKGGVDDLEKSNDYLHWMIESLGSEENPLGTLNDILEWKNRVHEGDE